MMRLVPTDLLNELERLVPVKPNAITWERGVEILNFVQDKFIPALAPTPAAPAASGDELVARLTDCLNHAVTQLTTAALDENFDSQDCMDCVERIQDTLKPMGKTSDWHTLSNWYDRLCAACGVDNGDEIDILPVAEKMLHEAAAALCARSEWMPIESAPKDGTEFLAVTDYGKRCTMKFNGREIVRTVTCRRCDGMGLGGLTSWSPLIPAPPK